MQVLRPRGEVVSRARCAAIFGIARTTLDDWVKRGCPVHRPATGKGVEAQFDTAAVAEWRLAGALVEAGPDNLDAQREKARLYKEQADNVALKNAALRGELLPKDEVLEGWQAAIGRARALLLGIPPGVSPELVLRVRQERDDHKAERAVYDLLTDQIDHALNELANTSVDDGDDEEAA